ncbi:MAG: translocation/assembly module TamB domain-containing protein [Candidatus Zixiibacteriota bacterium]|nr:MAG: translocation/assembly module TamB domain-containing protein [candidate division Zixibacteria bacterium]
MRLAFKIPSYILGMILVIILAGFYVYYFTTLPESELNNWISSLISSEEDITINVRRVNRDIWDHLTLEGVSVAPRREDRTPAVYISRITLDYDIIPVLQNKNLYRSLVIDTVLVEFPSSLDTGEEISPGERDFELPINATINRVFINVIDMILSNGEKINLNGLALSAKAHNNQLDIDLDNISGRWPARDIHVYSVSGNFSYNIDGISVDNLNITTSRSSIYAEGVVGHNFVDGIDLTIDCNPINLVEIRNLSGVKVDGNLRANGSIKGSLTGFAGNVVVNGLFFDRRFEDLNLKYSYMDKALNFENIDGKIFKSVFKGRGRLDFSTMPEKYSYSGNIEHLNLINLGPDLRTDFTGYADMLGEGLGVNSFFMQIDCELDSVRIEDYYFDSVSGPFDLDLSRLEFHDGFEARYKNTRVSAAGRLEYDGDIDVRGKADFQDLTDYTGQIFIKNLGGRGTADFRVTGPTRDFDIKATFLSDSCWTYGLEPGVLAVNADLKSFISHRVGTVNGNWTGGELYSVTTDSGCFRVIVSGDRVFIDSAHINSRSGGMWFRGNFDGTTVPPVFTVDTLTADIYGNIISSDYPLVFALYDRETEFSRFKLLFGSGAIELKGVVTTELEMDLDFLAEGFQIQPLLERVYPERRIEGVFSGNAEFSGNFDSPNIVSFINVDSLKVDNIFVGNFEAESDYNDGYLVTKKGRLETPRGNYEFFGSLPMNLSFEEVENRFPNDPVDMRLTASGNRLILSEVFISTIDSFFTEYFFDVSFTGNYEKPLITGTGEIKDGFLKTLYLETPLDSIQATINMENEIIRIVDASATVSVRQTEVDRALKGLISGIDKKDKKPIVRAGGTMKLLGLGSFLYDINVIGENFFFKSDQYDLSGIADFNLSIIGPTPPTVKGDINVTKFDMKEEFESFYDPEFELADAAIEDSSMWDLNLDISAKNNIWIKNSEVDAEFKSDIHVDRNVGVLGILGTLEVIRGDYKGILYSLTGRKFKTKSGIMTFNNVANVNPEIDFIVSTRLRNRESEASITEVELNITGTLFEPKINTTETSVLSREDVIRLLVENNLVTSGGTGSVIENAGVLFQSMGVDPFTTQGLLEEIEIGADERDREKTRISVAKYISPDLYLRYSQRFSADDPGRMLGVEYYLNNNFLLKASQGQQGSDYEGISLDINFNYEF